MTDSSEISEFIQKGKDDVIDFCGRSKQKIIENPLKFSFYFVMILMIAIVFIYGLITNGRSIVEMFWQNPNGVGGDFFFSFRTSMRIGKDIYPPLIYVFFRICGMLALPLPEGVSDIRAEQMAFMIYTVYMIICSIFIYKIINKMKRGSNMEKTVFFIVCVLSLPFLYLFERANILYLCLLFVLLFIYYYDSEDGRKRLLAYICLDIAIGIKLYPAALFILILSRRKMKEVLTFIVISVIIFIWPFLFTDGSIFQYVQNIFRISVVFTMPRADLINFNNTMFVLARFMNFEHSESVSTIIGYAVVLFSIFVAMFCDKKEQWKVVTLAILCMVLFTGFKPVYALVYFVIPLIMFIDSKGASRVATDWIYLIAFLLIFIPMPETFIQVCDVEIYDDYWMFAPLSLFIEMVGEYILLALVMIQLVPSAVRNALNMISEKRSEHNQ